MGRLFKTHISSKQDVKSTLTSVIEVSLQLNSFERFLKNFLISWKRICRRVKRLFWTSALTQSNNTSTPVATDSRRLIWRSLPSCRACDTRSASTPRRLTTLSRRSTPARLPTSPRKESWTRQRRKVCIVVAVARLNLSFLPQSIVWCILSTKQHVF